MAAVVAAEMIMTGIGAEEVEDEENSTSKRGMEEAVVKEGVEQDLRCIEADTVGEENELDADLEREFLLQEEEAKSKFQAASSTPAGEDVEVEEGQDGGNGGNRERGLLPHFGATWESFGDLDDAAVDRSRTREMKTWDKESVVHGSGGSVPDYRATGWEKGLGLGLEAAGILDKLGQFDTAEMRIYASALLRQRESFLAKFRVSEAEALKVVTGAQRRAESDCSGIGKTLTLFPEVEPVQLSAALEMGEKKTVIDSVLLQGGARRHILSGSSSKVSVRTGTSLERQYSMGSTSTVESPDISVTQEKKRNHRPRAPTSAREKADASAGGQGAASPRLSFCFPGWGVDISKGENRASVVRYHNQVEEEEELGPETSKWSAKRARASPKSCSRQPESQEEEEEEEAFVENLGDRSPVWELPDEILLQVMRKVEVRDLCSSVQTCKRWYAVGLQNDLWELLLGDVDHGLWSDSSSDVMPRWLCKKNLCLSESVRVRFNVFSKGYDYLRRALCEWWDNRLHSTRYPSKAIYSIIRKLTVNDWSLLYEAFGVVFTDRTDRIASALLRKLKPVDCGGSRQTVPEPGLARNRESSVAVWNLRSLYENPKCVFPFSGSSNSKFEVQWKSCSVKEVSQEEGLAGKDLWKSLLKVWAKYKRWLLLISSHCPDLNYEVTVERARQAILLKMCWLWFVDVLTMFDEFR